MDGKSIKNANDTSNEEENFLDFDNFKQFYEKFSQTLKETVQTSNNLFKNNDDLTYYLSFPAFKKSLINENNRLLKSISSLLKFQCLKKPNQICSNDIEIDDKTDFIIDANDQLIERLGIQLDEIEGLRKKTETEMKLTTIIPTNRNINTSWNKETGMVQKAAIQISNKTILKPQQHFIDKIDNSYLPFLPKLKIKVNSKSPLPEIFKRLDEIGVDEATFTDHPELLINPYLPELELHEIDQNEYLCEKEAIWGKSLDETEFEYIDSIDGLDRIKTELSMKNRDRIKEIAVDLEHHNHRSYLGFTCLMQISTRYKDYIIDTIKLRNHIFILNEIFTDSTLLKVFHGADSDIDWLQKDFGIYVVNMFDTGQASRLLQYPHFSLSFLLKKFINIQAQKQYQMSDWRQRPLSKELLNYAREDTHYLLFIYDNLRNELARVSIQQLKLCFDKSKSLCKKTYKKPVFYSNNYLNLCAHNEHLNVKQLKALELLYEWRDRASRENDESCEYVLKNHQLLKIAELLPREIYGILALCNPVSHVVEKNLHQIHELILKARDYQGDLITSSNLDVSTTATTNSFIHLPLFDPDSILNCPHDSAHFNVKNNEDEEVRNVNTTNGNNMSKLKDLLIKPTTLNNNFDVPNGIEFLTDNTLFADIKNKLEEENYVKIGKRKLKREDKINKIKNSMINPFEKYLTNELRRGKNLNKDEEEKWTLLRTNILMNGLISKNSDNQKSNELVQPKVEDLPDNNLIPLKLQIRQQNQQLSTKTPKSIKKMVKELEISNAIEERNRQREEQEANSDLILDDEYQKSIRNNLELLAENVRKNSQTSTSSITTAVGGFNYDNQNLNKAFSSNKNQNKFYDPTNQKVKKFGGRVNKRGNNFNAAASISRSRNNQSSSFKK